MENKKYWQAFLLALLVGSFVMAFYPVWKGLIQTWTGSEDYSHGFFIVPLCLYLAWRKREALFEIPKNPSRGGFLIVGGCLLIYIVSFLGEIITLVSLSMVLFLAGATLYLWNFKVLRELGFLFFLMLFMIPVPEQIYSQLTIPLQLLVSKISVFAAGNLGIPVFREGNVINLPGQALQVVQACSGLRSIMTLLTLGAIIGHLTLRSKILQGILLISALPAAILVNIVRVLLMILAFYFFSYDLTEGTLHTLFGIFIFFLAFILILVMKNLMVIIEKKIIPE